MATIEDLRKKINIGKEYELFELVACVDILSQMTPLYFMK